MRNYLILINNAPGMSLYHTKFGAFLEKQGNNVFYAYSDQLAINECFNKETSFVFSDYFKANYNRQRIIDDKYKNINVWTASFSDFDRMLNNDIKAKSCDYYESLFVNLVNFYDSIFSNNKIDCVIYENVSNSFAYFCFEVGKVHGVDYIGYCPSKLPNRIEIQNEIMNTCNQFSKIFSEIDFEKLDEVKKLWVGNYLKKYNGTIPSYHPVEHPLCYDYSFFKLYFSRKKVNLILEALKSICKFKDYYYYYQINNPLKLYLKFFIKQIRRRLKLLVLKKSFDKVNYKENYYIFPLQMVPESSTSVWAKHNTNQLNVIVNIAYNLPFGTKLYVKEHFVNFGTPSLKFYKELKNIPNVKFIHPHAQNFPLIQNSIGVLTLTSTMGFEALMMKRPVVVIGNIFYEKHPNCHKLKSFDDLFGVLNSMKEKTFLNSEPFDSLNQKFIAAYYKMTFEGDTDFASYKKTDYEKFINSLYGAIKDKYEIN